MSKHPVIPLIVMAAMVVAASRASAMTFGCVAGGLLIGALLCERLAHLLTGKRWWLPMVLVIAVFPAVLLLLDHPDSGAAKILIAVFAIGVGAWSGSIFRRNSRQRLAARDFFLVLAVIGAFLGAAFAHDYLLPLALVPAGIAFLIWLVPYVRRRFRW